MFCLNRQIVIPPISFHMKPTSCVVLAYALKGPLTDFSRVAKVLKERALYCVYGLLTLSVRARCAKNFLSSTSSNSPNKMKQ